MSAMKRLLEDLDDLESAGRSLKRRGRVSDAASIENYVSAVRKQLRG